MTARTVKTTRRVTRPPRYLQVAHRLSEEISEGIHPVGGLMPTEH